MRCPTATVSICAVVSAFAGPALATPVEDGNVDAVVVTAQRREQAAQDVPISLTIFGSDEIRKARLHDVDDVVSRTAGLAYDALPSGQPRLYIRGIGSGDLNPAGDPSTAVFLDDIYLGRPAASVFDLFDVARVEVLKGPQGTLFGRNVVGGAIRIVTQAPDPDAFAASAEATLGNYDTRELAGMINAPIAQGQAAVRGAISWRAHDGYVQNTYTGGRLDDADRKSARLQWLARASDRLTLRLGVDGARDRSQGVAFHPFARDPASGLGPLWTLDTRPKIAAPDNNGYQKRDAWGGRAEATWALDAVTVDLLGSFRQVSYDTAVDFDGGNPTFNRISVEGGSSEDTRFSSLEAKVSAPAGSQLAWVAGVYYFTQHVSRQDRTKALVRPSLSAPVPTALPTELNDQRADLDSLAGYADATWSVSERWAVFGGLRYTRDDKRYWLSNEASPAIVRSRERFSANLAKTFNATTWRLGADYRLSPGVKLYAQAARGFKSGGFQDGPTTLAAARVPFAPEHATQYEIGEKGVFAGGRLVWNNALYVIDYNDLQTSQLEGLGLVVRNAGKATIKGYETDADLTIGSGVSLTIGYAYTNARLDRFINAGVDLSGNRIQRSPRDKVRLSPRWEGRLSADLRLSVRADLQYESKIFDDNDNNALEVRKASTRLDARAELEGSGWRLAVWGRNLGDQAIRNFQTTLLGADVGTYAPPRTVGVTLGWTY